MQLQASMQLAHSRPAYPVRTEYICGHITTLH